MKKLIYFALLLVPTWACTQQKEIVKSNTTGPIVSKDSTEYEITIIDPDFEQWYMLRYSPAKDRSNEFYRSKNTLGVNNWNSYFTRNKYNRVVESYIDYVQNVDYGIEVNRRLYWYFSYIEEKFGIRLLR